MLASDLTPSICGLEYIIWKKRKKKKKKNRKKKNKHVIDTDGRRISFIFEYGVTPFICL